MGWNMKDSESGFDQVDRQIVALLGEDGRAASNEIARKLDVSEGTVRNRIRRLADSGSLKIAAQVNPDILPDKALAILEIKVAVTKDLTKTAKRIASLPGVCSVYIVTGGMDIMAEVLVDAKFGLVDFIDKHLASVPGVVSTESHMVMKQYNKWPSGICSV